MQAGDGIDLRLLAAALLLLAACTTDASDPPRPAPNDAAATEDAAASPLDAGSDAAPDAAAYEPPTVELPDPDSDEELWLSSTGLYVDIERKQLAPDLQAFEPAYRLWSDGADKQRWLRLPRGSQIDSADMDHWQFPVGTMFWKEFGRDGKRYETRLIARTGDGPNDYWMGAFVWLDDESDARFVPDGAKNVRDSDHDVPTVKNCGTCHNGEAGRVLGYSAVQQRAVAAEQLTVVPEAAFEVPGDATVRAALGYLHANCAHCHNPRGSARPDTDMNLRLAVGDRRPEDTATYRSTLGVALQYFESEPFELRVAEGDPERSGLLFRMTERGPKTQMPPLASEFVDEAGVETVRAWILAL